MEKWMPAFAGMTEKNKTSIHSLTVDLLNWRHCERSEAIQSRRIVRTLVAPQPLPPDRDDARPSRGHWIASSLRSSQ
jgi:hypothetical protein